MVYKCLVMLVLFLSVSGPSISDAQVSSQGEPTIGESFRRFFFGEEKSAAKLNTPKKVIDRALDQAMKGDFTEFDRLVYVRPYASNEYVESDSEKLFNDLKEIVKASSKPPRAEILWPPKTKSFTMLNKDTWTEVEETHTVRLYGDDDQLMGEIPVTCYTLKNCIDQLVTGFCGVEFGRN